jgi:putative restriction endonuclease
MSTESALSKYIYEFSRLRTDRTGHWNAATQFQAPHKPILLLVILDLFAEGRVQANLIMITAELGELFAAYWSRIISPEHRGNLALPFFHLRSSGFWHLIPRPGQENVLENIRQIDTLNQLQKLILGASLDEELYFLLQDEKYRNALKSVLVQTYFSQDSQSALISQGVINQQSFQYSQQLIEQARREIKETVDDVYQPIVRDQGFRRAVVRIYDHRCALCGVRMLTIDGHSVVDAAHIVPWAVTHNDDPHNGMALCRLCHWTFDEGLISVSKTYMLILSTELRANTNVAGHLLTLEGRTLIGPSEQVLWPDLESLSWHRHNVFRKI